MEDPTHGVARPRAGRRLARYPSSEELARLLEATAQEREATLPSVEQLEAELRSDDEPSDD
ncbi:MAG: hypothetical protein C4331_19210 [Meiothermus sp.]